MSLNYEPTSWENGKTVLKAEHLRKIEKGITDIISENDAIYKDEDTRKSNEKQRQEEHSRKMNEVSEVVSDIQKDYDSLQKIIIDENASANLQNQINQTNSQLEHSVDNLYKLHSLKMKFIYRPKALGGDVDDGEAILNALQNDEVVYLPKATYNINNTIKIPSNRKLIGEDGAKIYFDQPNVDQNHILVIDETSNNVTIENIIIEGSVLYKKNSFGVLVNGLSPSVKTSDINIKNCIIRNISSAGIVAREVKNITIENCYIENTNRDGIQVTGCENFLINNCKTYNTGDDGIGCHAGYSDKICYGIISNNIIKNSMVARGIACAGSSNIVISNNLVDGFGQAGIIVLRDGGFVEGNNIPKDFSIIGNTIVNRNENTEYQGGTCGIYVYDGSVTGIKNINIVGNNITSKASNGLKYGIRLLEYTQDVNISSNLIEAIYGFSFGAKVYNININSNIVKCSETFISCWGDTKTEQAILINGNKAIGDNTGKAMSINGLCRLIVTSNEFIDFPLSCDSSNLKANVYDNTFVNCPQFGKRGFLYDIESKTFTDF